jgi:hypothetical protein
MNKPDRTNIRLPLSRSETGKDFAVVDVRLKSGKIVNYVLLDKDGIAVGVVVGGHTGVDDSRLGFEQHEIEAFRRRGWAAKLGFAKWHLLKQESHGA